MCMCMCMCMCNNNNTDKLGYEAHMVGKWHLGMAKWAQTPVGRGFQTFVVFARATHTRVSTHARVSTHTACV